MINNNPKIKLHHEIFQEKHLPKNSEYKSLPELFQEKPPPKISLQ